MVAIHQMFLRAPSKPLLALTSEINGEVFLFEPAPQNTIVSGISHAGATGGSGNYTYNWSVISGQATVSSPSNASYVELSALVPKNQQVTGVVRLTLSDGFITKNFNRNYQLEYRTNL